MRRTEESKIRALIAEAVAGSLNEAQGEERGARIQRLANMMLTKSRRGLSSEMLSSFVGSLSQSDRSFYDDNARDIVRAYSSIRSEREQYSSASPRAAAPYTDEEGAGLAPEAEAGEGEEPKTKLDKETIRFLDRKKAEMEEYIRTHPEAVAAAAPGSEVDLGTRAQRSRPESILLSPEMERGRVGQVAGRMPSVGVAHHHMVALVEQDPLYSARRQAVGALAAVNENNDDPTRMVKRALYKDATLPSQVPRSLSASIIRDMVITTAVADNLNTSTGKRASEMPPPPGLVTSANAVKFANDLLGSYTRLARMQSADVTDELIEKEAEDLLGKSSGDIFDVLSHVADFYFPEASSSRKVGGYDYKANNPAAAKLVIERLRHQSSTLRPHVQRLETAERKIRRIGGGGSTLEVETMPVSGRDPVTGKKKTTDVFAGVRVRPITGGIIIPKTFTGVDEEEGSTDLTDAERAAFDQAGAAQFKLTQARGYYLVARACEILRIRDRVDTFYKNKNMLGVAEDLRAVFDGLDEVLSAHPYARLGVKDIAAAKSAIRDVMASSGEEGEAEAAEGDLADRPTLEMGDKTLSAAEKVLPLVVDEVARADLSYIIEAAQSGKGIVNREAIERLLEALGKKVNTKQAGASLIFSLNYALSSSEEGSEFTITALEGSTRVKSTALSSAADGGARVTVRPDVEGNEADNDVLQEAIDNILSKEESWKTVQTGMHELEKTLTVPTAAVRGGQRHLMSIKNVMERHLQDSKVHVSERIRRAIGARKSLMEIINGATSSLAGLVKRVKRDQAEAYRVMFSIKDRGERSPVRSAAIGAALKAAYTASASPDNIMQSVQRRINTARTLRCESEPGRIFLTPFNAIMGAAQIVAERGFREEGRTVVSTRGSTQDYSDDLRYVPPTDNGSPYAIPMGPNTGAQKITGKDKREYVESLLARTSTIYRYIMGDFVGPGGVVVIPSMMRTPSTDNVLTLGVGRVVHRDVHKIVVTDRILSSLPEKMREAVGPLVGKGGMEVNLMSVTVSFPPEQWRIGRQAYDISLKSEKQRRIAKLVEDLEGMRSASPEALDNKRRAIYDAQHDLNSVVPINAARVRSCLTRSDTSLNALFVNENVTLDEATGVLTLSNIAPAFLDDFSRHTTERSTYDWPESVQVATQTVRNAQTLETLGHGKGIYVPASAVQIKPEHLAETASPFNVNQAMSANGSRVITYRVGMSGGNRSFRVDASNFAFIDLTQQAQDYAGKMTRRLVSVGDSLGMGGRRVLAQLGTPADASFPESYPIVITVPQEVSPEQVDAIRSTVETVQGFNRDYYFSGMNEGAASRRGRGDTALVYELRAGRRERMNTISGYSPSQGQDIKLGDLVYIDPMYDVANNQTSAFQTSYLGAANSSTPPELYGVGKVARIYFHGTAGGNNPLTLDARNPGEVRALLLDLEFRGDQVKTHSVRGSINSPNVTLPGVGIAFVKKVRVDLMPELAKLDPDRPMSENTEDAYPSRVGEIKAPYIVAGWTLPSRVDKQPASSLAVSTRLRIGGRYRIVQPNHPSVGMAGVLAGFVGATQLTQGQRNSISGGDIEPTQVNAILTVAGANLIGSIRAVLDDLSADIVGKPYSSGAVRKLFTHIDRDITLRYINNPRGAKGYAAFDAGSWNVPDAATTVGPGAARGYVQDRIGTRRVNNQSIPEHGSGAWQEFHNTGHAVHPGAKQFAELTGVRREVKPIPRPGSANTIYGCNAILRAIIEHGPEKTMTAEESYEAERHFFTSEEATNIAGSYGKGAKEQYPMGMHTDEAQYFNTLKAVWLMAGGGKSGRSTEGAQNQYYGYSVHRVGSPVGTSFRFQLSDDPETGGLEYTRLLRGEIRAVMSRVQSAIDSVSALISAAKVPGTLVDPDTLTLADAIVKGLDEKVLKVMASGLTYINSLGYEEDGKKVNTLDVWLKAKDELERGTRAVRHDFSPQTQTALKDLRDRVWSSHASPVDEGERIFGAAPIPGAATVKLIGSQIVITFSRPVAARDPGSRVRWASLQAEVLDKVEEILNTTSLRVKGDPRRPESAEVVKDTPRSKGIKSFIANAKGRLNVSVAPSVDPSALRTRGSALASLTAWESDILSHKPLGEILDQDVVDDYMDEDPGPDITTGFLLADGSVRLRDDSFCNIVYVYEQDFISAERIFVNDVEAFARDTLSPLLQEIERTVESAEDVDPRVSSKIVGAITAYQAQMSSEAMRHLRDLEHDRNLRLIQYTKGTVGSAGKRESSEPLGVKDTTPDMVARKAAELCYSLEVAFRDIAHIAENGYVVERRVPADRDDVLEVMQDARSMNERGMLENMGAFPSIASVNGIITEISKMTRSASSARLDQVCVPIKSDAVGKLLPLLRLRGNVEIPEDAHADLLRSIEPA